MNIKKIIQALILIIIFLLVPEIIILIPPISQKVYGYMGFYPELIYIFKVLFVNGTILWLFREYNKNNK